MYYISAILISVFFYLIIKEKTSTTLKDPPKPNNIILYRLLDLYNSKKADLNRSLFLIIFISIVYALFISVLPGHETVLCLVSAADECAGGDGDTDSSACTAYGGCNGGPAWSIGGEVDATTCCGDDTSTNFVKTESSSTDAPSGYNDAITACCLVNTSCNYNDQCNATGEISNASIPNTAWCYLSTWYGGDLNNSACTVILGSGYWNLGGNTSASTCCGDDSNEFQITETGSTDAPSGYNDGITACCATSTDCNYNDVCSATYTFSSEAAPNKAYCDQGTWLGGDYNQTVCNAIAGNNHWNIGGEVNATVCCGDDSNEFNLTRQVDESTVPSGFSDDDTDNACCSASTDCVNASTCYDIGYSSTDFDSDGDVEYCYNNQWIDPDGYVSIKNLGQTGIEQTNQEYTSSRSVYLELNYSHEGLKCRYINHVNDSDLPTDDTTGWSLWETCVTSKLWLLSEGDGLKTVYYNINYSGFNITFNDTIYYNYTGSGLDVTLPTLPTVYHNNYTNDNQSITINWFNASDPESTTLDIDLQYNVILYNSSGGTHGDITTTATSYTFTGFNFPHNTTLYANVSVINSAGMKINATSDPLVIDLQAPTLSLFNGSFKNLTSLSYQSLKTLPNENTWVHANLVNFSWTGSDVTSSIAGYSYILTANANTLPDNIPEGTPGSLHNEISKSYSAQASNKYYFYIKAKDLAGNWGPIQSINFSIDSTGSSKPEIITESKSDSNIAYTWSASTDEESGITKYMINLTDENNIVNASATITDTGNRNHTFTSIGSGNFNATVGAMNGVGIWRWSNQDKITTDFDAPIIYATPNRTVITSSPILKAWTNEQATCNYNSTPNNIQFKYTNTTYHETKLSSLSNGHYTYVITCSDPYDNSASFNVNFTINSNLYPDTISSSNTLNTYRGLLTTFSVNLLDSAVETSGLTVDMFKLYIDGIEDEVTVFDLGDSYYNVSFEAPDSVSNYTLRITVNDTLDKNITLVVKDLYLSALYKDTFISSAPENTNHITYFTSGRRIGFASDSDINLNNYVMAANELNMTNVNVNDNLFIINTKPTVGILGREKYLKEQSFLKLNNPSFAYEIIDTYILNYVLKSNEFNIVSNSSDINIGRYNYILQKSVSNTGKKEVLITDEE